MSKSAFYFKFWVPSDAPDGHEFTKGFLFELNSSVPDLGVVREDRSFEQRIDYLETHYGVHDWSNYPTDHCEAMGYTSTEVTEDKAQELMHEWHAYFEQFGLSPSNIVDIPLTNYTDEDIVEYLQSKTDQA